MVARRAASYTPADASRVLTGVAPTVKSPSPVLASLVPGQGRMSAPILFLGLFCLLYAISCGFITALVESNVARLTETAGMGQTQFEKARDEMLGNMEKEQLENARGARARAAVKERFDAIRTADAEGATFAGAQAFIGSPEGRRAVQLAQIDAFLKFQYFVVALMLFVRIPAVRWVALVLSGAHIALHLFMVFSLDSGLQIAADAATPAYEAALDANGQSVEAGFLGGHARSGTLVFASASLLFPTILLLLFLRRDGFAARFRNQPPAPPAA